MEERVFNARIKKFVADNYADCNLNIGYIAEHFGMNKKYLGRVFKEETGSTLLDYINHCRILKAKELMLTEQVSIKELSKLVGYADERTFRRAFIKVEGKLPSDVAAKS